MEPQFCEQAATDFFRRCESLRTDEAAPSLSFFRIHPSSFILHPSRPAFTLIELVIVLTLLAILVAATIPSVRGLKDEQVAREPVTALVKLAKEARLHAMRDKRPYQIAFTVKGFSATRYLSPYLQLAQLDEFVQKVENDASQREELGLNNSPPQAADASSNKGSSTSNPAPVFKEWTQNYALPENVNYSVQYWYEQDATPIEGDAVKLWVFQPSGVTSPLTVKLERQKASFAATFSALTADVVKETSDIHK